MKAARKARAKIARLSVSVGAHLDLDDVAAGHPLAQEQLASLRLTAKRYETVRRMNPLLWSQTWEAIMQTGKPFDEMIDDLRPFMFPQGRS